MPRRRLRSPVSIHLDTETPLERLGALRCHKRQDPVPSPKSGVDAPGQACKVCPVLRIPPGSTPPQPLGPCECRTARPLLDPAVA
eukprot:2703807-Amphidinium_carterae.2